jgi:hypothetical protein
MKNLPEDLLSAQEATLIVSFFQIESKTISDALRHHHLRN